MLDDIARTIVPGTTAAALAAAIVGYLLKLYIEKRFDRIEKSAQELRTTSLSLKQGMRTAERDALVAFRVAVEKWEDFLQSLVFDYSMMPAAAADITQLYKSDKELFLAVKIAVVTVSTYLRNRELENELMTTVLRLRQAYYPLINQSLPKLIDLQAQLMPVEIKLKKFAEGGMQDAAHAPTREDQEKSGALQQQMTDEMQQFSTSLLSQYKGIAEQLVSLKEAVNQYIYRPVTDARLDTD